MSPASKGDTIVVSVKDWVGKPFPLRTYVLGVQGYLNGHWILLYYAEKCSRCWSLLTSIANTTSNLAVVEVPPSGEFGSWERNEKARIWLQLDAAYDWLRRRQCTFILLMESYPKCTTRDHQDAPNNRVHFQRPMWSESIWPEPSVNQAGCQSKCDPIQHVHGDLATEPEHARKLGRDMCQQSRSRDKTEHGHEIGPFRHSQ